MHDKGHQGFKVIAIRICVGVSGRPAVAIPGPLVVQLPGGGHEPALELPVPYSVTKF